MLATDKLLSPPMNALMRQVLSRPGIQHYFVKGLKGRPGVEILRKSGTWRQTHADSALVECRGKRYVLVGIAERAEGGEWLARLAGPMHDLIVPPEREHVASNFSSVDRINGSLDAPESFAGFCPLRLGARPPNSCAVRSR